MADLDDVPKPGSIEDDVPLVRPFWTFQFLICDIAALTGPDADQLVGVDSAVSARRPASRP
ncbi:hypothetical protein ASF21_15445 [Arthrobacter sp. Leaf234]|nr:hypothetical protein ASF21_15445 [Arthrobacter sp. Leaf234]